MSFSIQCNSKVLFLPEGSLELTGSKRFDDELFWFVKTADSNVSPHTPRWSFQANGSGWMVVAQVCRHAGVCEGGSIKIGTSRQTAHDISPEEYIGDYREKAAAKQTLTLSTLKSVGHSSVGFGNFKKAMIDDVSKTPFFSVLREYQQEEAIRSVERLKNGYKMSEESCYPGSEQTYMFMLKCETTNDFVEWVKMRNALTPLKIWTHHE